MMEVNIVYLTRVGNVVVVSVVCVVVARIKQQESLIIKTISLIVNRIYIYIYNICIFDILCFKNKGTE